MPVPRRLDAAQLCRHCVPGQFRFVTTAELADFDATPGQDRAVEAIRFGVAMGRAGYNVYAMGSEGLGRHTAVRRILEQKAAGGNPPDDWCYVFNFDTPHRPCALRLPAGKGPDFRRHMQRLVEDLGAAIPAAFETEEYRTRRNEIETEFGERRDAAIREVGAHAQKLGLTLLRTPTGFGFAPVRGDGVMSPEDFDKLPADEKKRLEANTAALQEELERVIHEAPRWRREAQERIRALNRQVISAAVNSLIEDLKLAYAGMPDVARFITRVQKDVLDHAEFFQQPKNGDRPTLFGIPLVAPESEEAPLRRYQVNLLVTHTGEAGVPIIHEDNPTHDNIIGRIEHMAQMGTLVTDFMLIKPGALHLGNGGFIVLDAVKVLTQPFAWEALKRALRSREIRIESVGQMLSLVSTVSLAPESIPLDIKVVLVGPRYLYYLLHAYDPDFGELFKVMADFEEDVQRGPDSDELHARVIATIARREGLRALDREAVARVIDHSSRVAGDAEKLSANIEDLCDLLREADHCAGAGGHDAVTLADIQHAIEARERRAQRIRDRMREQILRGLLLVDTSGRRVGQVNGLSVVPLGPGTFGMPHRITARVRPGTGKVLDIERESELGGPIHSKGVLILTGFLSARYALRRSLSLAASLVFEQSYGMVEGDSASSAELCALMSAIAGLPLRQDLAVTGSVNQHGDIQAIGGVNEKIEGFFDICRERGLTGTQGVLIPAANVRHLMLRADVVRAAAEQRFHIFPVTTVDEGMALLTGIPAGERSAAGRFPAGTVNERIETKLQQFAERVHPPDNHKPRTDDGGRSRRQ
jgi:lon-related putative ATP-dependent protease